jgi:hypothetical protein
MNPFDSLSLSFFNLLLSYLPCNLLDNQVLDVLISSHHHLSDTGCQASSSRADTGCQASQVLASSNMMYSWNHNHFMLYWTCNQLGFVTLRSLNLTKTSERVCYTLCSYVSLCSLSLLPFSPSKPGDNP